MDRAVSDIIIVTISVAIICATVLTGYRLSLRGRRADRDAQAGLPDELQAEFDTLRAELGGQIAELQERLDFTERLLARQSAVPEPRNRDSAESGGA